jgi:nitrogen-specific signal transduction histidine kinase
MKPSEEILQLLPIAVLVFDENGIFCYANEYACQLFKINAQQSQGVMYHLLLPDLNAANCSPSPTSPPQPICNKPLGHLEEGKIVLTRQGQKLFCRSLFLPNNNSHGERLVVLVEDMNDSANLAGRVLEDERLMGVTEISNTMAHKLNQYLQVIMGYISLMTLEMDPEHQCYDYLNKILEQLENIRATTYMLSNIHRYAIIERPDGRRMFDLDMAAEEYAFLNFK